VNSDSNEHSLLNYVRKELRAYVNFNPVKSGMKFAHVSSLELISEQLTAEYADRAKLLICSRSCRLDHRPACVLRTPDIHM